MKLSIVILCWNDRKLIANCISSICATTHSTEFEIIVSDNGSTDDSVEYIHREFPKVRVIENGANLRFAKGNNVGIQASQGEYILILNPDTIIHEGALDKIVAFADRHPEAGAFGCKILNVDGSFQGCIWPMMTLRTEWCHALSLGFLSYLSDFFLPGAYVGWDGNTEKTVGWPAGCFLLTRGAVVKQIGGFDEQFFYYYEDTDLCRRIWAAGYPILYTPEMSITHIGGQSTHKRLPAIGFAIDAQVTRYLYYYKYNGRSGARSARRSILTGLFLRRAVYGSIQIFSPNEERKKRLELLKDLFEWNYRVDPIRLVEHGEEPKLGVKPLNRVLDR